MAKQRKGGRDGLTVGDLLEFCRIFEQLPSGTGLQAIGRLRSDERDAAADLIARLEQELGYSLTSGARGSPAEPTAEGRAFYNAVVGPLYNLRAALETPGGSVRVRGSEFALHFFLPQVMGGFL